jgi:Lar family restriction alleviation protein
MINPCPFCGGSAHIENPESDKYYWRRYITCDECSANNDGGDPTPLSEAEAIEAWNTRKWQHL